LTVESLLNVLNTSLENVEATLSLDGRYIHFTSTLNSGLELLVTDDIIALDLISNLFSGEATISNIDDSYKSHYPTFQEDASLYTGGIFIEDKYNTVVYYCNKQGLYLTDSPNYSGRVPDSLATDLNDRLLAEKPLYLLNKERYETEFYLEKYPSNPYFQYITIKDYFNISSHEWEQVVTTVRKEKNISSGTYRDVVVDPAEVFINIYPTFEGTISEETGIRFEAIPLLDYKKGVIKANFVANKSRVGFYKQFYGVSYYESDNYKNNLFDMKSETPYNWNGLISGSYTVNDFRDPSKTSDSSGVVGISEIGIFNSRDELIAYATTPPIIINSSKHVLALNIAICQEALS
jgi:hypothetical protein